MMNDEALLAEIRDLLKIMSDEQQKLVKDIRELRDEHKKLKDEIRLSNFVLNNISVRNEMMN